MEKKDSVGWHTVWAPLINGCLSPPITLAPGNSVSDTLSLWGAPPRGNVDPEFIDTVFDGTCRLVWWNLVHHYNTDQSGFGDTVPLLHKISNEFTLRPRR